MMAGACTIARLHDCTMANTPTYKFSAKCSGRMMHFVGFISQMFLNLDERAVEGGCIPTTLN